MAEQCPTCTKIGDGILDLRHESDRLRVCIVHKPGEEIGRLVPSNYRWHLYNDLLDVQATQEHHSQLRAALVQLGVEVLTFADLVADVCGRMSGTDRKAFLQQMHDLNPSTPSYIIQQIKKWPPHIVASKLIEGILATETFAAIVHEAHYYFPPMANLLFLQDAAVVVGDRVIQGALKELVRLPEELLVETVLCNHPRLGPLASGSFWIDPGFRKRHGMYRTVKNYLQLDAARLRLNFDSIRKKDALSDDPWVGEIDRAHIQLENAIVAEGRSYLLEGGNILSLRTQTDGTAVIIAHNTRTSAEAIDELAYRLLRPPPTGSDPPIASVIVIDYVGTPEERLHLDMRMLVANSETIFVDRSLCSPVAQSTARFYLFTWKGDGSAPDAGLGYMLTPPIVIRAFPTLADAFHAAGVTMRLVPLPDRVAWDSSPPDAAPITATEAQELAQGWIGVQQAIAASALNALVVAPGLIVGFSRHKDFFEKHLQAICMPLSALSEGDYEGLHCCALRTKLRDKNAGRLCAVLVPGDELVRAGGGPRSLVLPLCRKREGSS